jgi:hypothetical protein
LRKVSATRKIIEQTLGYKSWAKSASVRELGNLCAGHFEGGSLKQAFEERYWRGLPSRYEMSVTVAIVAFMMDDHAHCQLRHDFPVRAYEYALSYGPGGPCSPFNGSVATDTTRCDPTWCGDGRSAQLDLPRRYDHEGPPIQLTRTVFAVAAAWEGSSIQSSDRRSRSPPHGAHRGRRNDKRAPRRSRQFCTSPTCLRQIENRTTYIRCVKLDASRASSPASVSSGNRP